MNRKEFMKKLEKLLWNISDSEREEALQYYHDYFDDAGEENEARVIEELVSPDQVAQKIKAGLSDSESELSGQGYRDTRFESKSGDLSDEQVPKEEAEIKKSFWKILEIILSPVILLLCAGLLLAALGIAIGIIAAIFGIVVAGFAILISGIFVTGVGIVQAFATPPVGIALAGTGCILTALGIFLSAVIIWCCVKLVPRLLRGIVGLLHYPFRKAGAKK